MPLAISNILWPADLDDAALAAARAAGADGIEVAPTRIAPWDELDAARLRAYRDRLADMGLAIPSLQAILFGRTDACLLADEDSYQCFADHIARAAEHASVLGAMRMVFGAPKNRRRESMPLDDAMKLAAARLRPVAERVHAYGVVLAVEHVPPDYGCDFIRTAAEAAVLVRAVDHPGLRLHLDAGALMMAGEDAAVVVAAHKDILAHVHMSRPQLAAVTEALPVDHALAAALAAADYRGWISIEIGPQEDALPCVTRALAVAREAYGATPRPHKLPL